MNEGRLRDDLTKIMLFAVIDQDKLPNKTASDILNREFIMQEMYLGLRDEDGKTYKKGDIVINRLAAKVDQAVAQAIMAISQIEALVPEVTGEDTLAVIDKTIKPFLDNPPNDFAVRQVSGMIAQAINKFIKGKE